MKTEDMETCLAFQEEWIEVARQLHHDLKLYIECVEKYVQFGEYNTVEEDNLLKQLKELDEIEKGWRKDNEGV